MFTHGDSFVLASRVVARRKIKPLRSRRFLARAESRRWRGLEVSVDRCADAPSAEARTTGVGDWMTPRARARSDRPGFGTYLARGRPRAAPTRATRTCGR